MSGSDDGGMYKDGDQMREELAAELDEHDDDDELSKLREARVAAIKARMANLADKQRSNHGTYTEVDEENFLSLVTETDTVVVAFYHADFNRCKIVDAHLERLAPKHFHTKFVKANVENCPFFVNKLAIRVLPTIVCFRDGLSVDRIVGFDELGNTDEFPTARLERRIAQSGCIEMEADDEGMSGGIRSANFVVDDFDGDSDVDEDF